jgi:hypothetical protein
MTLFIKKVIITVYNRTKFHKYQTSGILEAIKVYKKIEFAKI